MNNYIKLAATVRKHLVQMVAIFSPLPNRPSAFEEALSRFDSVFTPVGKTRKAHKAATAASVEILHALALQIEGIVNGKEFEGTAYAAALPKISVVLQLAFTCAAAVGADANVLLLPLLCKFFVAEGELEMAKFYAKLLMDTAPNAVWQARGSLQYADILRRQGVYDKAGELLQYAQRRLQEALGNDALKALSEVNKLQQRLSQKHYEGTRKENGGSGHIPSHGDVYWACCASDEDPRDARPVVVLSFYRHAERTRHAFVVPLRSNLENGGFEVNIEAGVGGLQRKTQAYCSGATRIALTCFKQRIGKLPKHIVEAIVFKVRRTFDLAAMH